MASESLSATIRAGYLEALRRFPPGPDTAIPAGFPTAVRSPARPVAEREQLWTFALERYRSGQRLWGPVILEALATDLLELVVTYQPRPPLVTDEDIRQQLVLEVLSAAAGIPLRTEPRWTALRIMRRASKRLSRWFRSAARAQSWEAPMGALVARQRSGKGRRIKTVAAFYISERAEECR